LLFLNSLELKGNIVIHKKLSKALFSYFNQHGILSLIYLLILQEQELIIKKTVLIIYLLRQYLDILTFLGEKDEVKLHYNIQNFYYHFDHKRIFSEHSFILTSTVLD